MVEIEDGLKSARSEGQSAAKQFEEVTRSNPCAPFFASILLSSSVSSSPILLSLPSVRFLLVLYSSSSEEVTRLPFTLSSSP